MSATDGKLVIISGPSGSGKTTLVSRLAQAEPQRVWVSVSATTRPPRPGEQNGKSYWFLSPERFQQMIREGQLLEWAEVYPGIFYGTPRQPVEEHLRQGKWVVLEIDVQGAQQVLQHFPNAITIFIRPRTWEELERRLRSRGTEDEQALHRRLETARREWQQATLYQFQVINDKIDEAVEQLRRILHGNWQASQTSQG